MMKLLFATVFAFALTLFSSDASAAKVGRKPASNNNWYLCENTKKVDHLDFNLVINLFEHKAGNNGDGSVDWMFDVTAIYGLHVLRGSMDADSTSGKISLKDSHEGSDAAHTFEGTLRFDQPKLSIAGVYNDSDVVNKRFSGSFKCKAMN